MLRSRIFLFTALSSLLPSFCTAKLGYDFGVAPSLNLLSDKYLSIRADNQEPGTFTTPGEFSKSDEMLCRNVRTFDF
jgi:hypothetical protein